MLSAELREALAAELKILDDAAAPIAAALAPLKKAADGVEELRACTLLRYGLLEEPTTCEGCNAFILHGDKYCPTDDAGPICEGCAPSYADAKELVDQRQHEAGDQYDDEDRERDGLFLRNYERHIADGGKPSDKLLYVYDCREIVLPERR